MRRIIILSVTFFCIVFHAWSQDVTGMTYNTGSNVRSSSLTTVSFERPDSGYRWIDRIQNIPVYMREFHETYGKLVQEVLDGGQNCLSDPTLGEVISYVFSDSLKNDTILTYNLPIACFTDTFLVGINFVASSDEINKAMDSINSLKDSVLNSYNHKVDVFTDYLALALNYDYPEAFWINPQYSFYRSSVVSSVFEPTISMFIYNYGYVIKFDLYLRLAVDNKYNSVYTDFLVEGPGDSLNFHYESVDMYNNTIDSIITECTSNSRYDTIAYFNEWLTMHNGYCTGNIGNTSSTIRSSYTAIMGRAGDDGPVCEGYARAFKVLCDRSGIPCVLVTGEARKDSLSTPESHMWNEVLMCDSLWYAVDVTWNDPVDSIRSGLACSENETDFWLLMGANDSVANDFSFAKSHTNAISTNSIYKSSWIYSDSSLIAANGFVPDCGNAVQDILYFQPDYLRAYSLNGLFLGTFSTFDALYRAVKGSGVIIVNGKKIILKNR